MADIDPTVPTPVPPAHGDNEIRGIRRVSLSPILEGRFGRMFRRLSPMPELPQTALEDLAKQMVDEDGPTGGWGGGTPEPRDNPDIPAGYTYFGQFLDHDITFDPVSSAERQRDPDALHNFRSPALDLDSVYGSGPVDEPFQYVKGSRGMQLLVEPNRNGIEDLPRNSQDVALTGDPRNDENTIVGQMHLAFLKLHNKLAAEVAADPAIPDQEKFERAQQRVRWHYQWAVLHDFVPRVIGRDTFEELIETDQSGRITNIKRRFYLPKKNPYMPVEFSGAAFRYGHSQVRGVYNLNSDVLDRPIFVAGPLPDEFADLRGFRRLPQAWTVDWATFFSLAGSTPQPSRRIDSKIVRALFELPEGGSLPLRNLIKGQILKLPSGQDVARFMGLEPLSSGELEGAPEPTPLWFYILKEAEKRSGGRFLGPVGGRSVGEVILGLIELDKQSWLSQDPTWTPNIPDADGDGIVGVPDLLAFATS